MQAFLRNSKGIFHFGVLGIPRPSNPMLQQDAIDNKSL